MTSYQLSQRINVHAILFYGLAVPLYRTATSIDKACTAFRAMLPTLLYALCVLTKALGLGAVIAATVAAVALIPPIFWLGLLIVGAFGWATYPRKQVRP